MNTIELIKDVCLFGGTIPNERIEEVRTFLDGIEKQLRIGGVSQQRELLERFHRQLVKDNDGRIGDQTEFIVSEYLKRSDCG